MFPMEFDYRILSTLPLPSIERVKSVTQLLMAVVIRRVLPFFKSKRGTDPLKLGRLPDRLTILRLEDENNAIRLVSLTTSTEEGWSIQVHERVFDYLSFVIPSDPETRIGEWTLEEQKMLSFSEFFLRHEVEHILYPERTEQDVVESDVDFALDRRSSDPTFYRMLCNALSDEMNGIKGQHYLTLMGSAERGLPTQGIVGSILGEYVSSLCDVPMGFLQQAFPALDTGIKSRVLEECYRKSRNPSSSLLQRTHFLRDALMLFDLLIKRDEKEALAVFDAFKDRWGLVELFKELDLPETAIEKKTPHELLRIFNVGLQGHLAEDAPLPLVRPAEAGPPDPHKSTELPQKSLRDRIEEARADAAFPRRVIDLIDKNKLNAVGHSGSKYSELIETLLAIPWGKIHKIRVSPKIFEEGLNRSHYGLQTPKEILCDFFTNLIWRYQRFTEAQAAAWHRTGSAFLLVGPPGVGKTSLAISVAQNLGIPCHKISLGGMRDEADMRGHGFTYEGSKPGAIVQGLMKMEVMNGMFILDEADKTEKFAIATLLEILDPEQNHLFHDKYTQTTIDIDLSNCHFFLTANTLDSVPPVVVNRCEVVVLDRYSVEEKVAIAQEYLIRRIRNNYQIGEEEIYFDPDEKAELLRYLIRTYTYEAGVRELERIIRTLFLRIQRKEILTKGERTVSVTREKIKEYLREPSRPRQISQEDAVGEMLALGVDVERGVGSIIPIQATRTGSRAPASGGRPGYLSVLHATGNIEKIMDESRKVASTGIFHCVEELGIDLKHAEDPIHLHFMGGSTKKDGPSAGGAIALVLASLLSGCRIRRDVAMTGEIDTKGRITAVGALALKVETAVNAGCKTVIIPRENLRGEGGIEQFPEALKEELQILSYEDWSGVHGPFDYLRHILEVVAVDNIVQASRVAFLYEADLENLENCFVSHANEVAAKVCCQQTLPSSCIRIFQVKGVEELDPKLFQFSNDQVGPFTVLLILPGIRDAVLDRLGDLAGRCEIVDFDPNRDKLSSALRGIMGTPRLASHWPLRLALVAPYFFLRRDGILGEVPCAESFPVEVSYFANNYTLQQVKIKRSKSVLDRVYSLLALLPPSELGMCPFLGKLEGVHVIDLSFIPEKYRLDVSRAEQVLIRSLTHWLNAVQKGVEETD